MSLYYNVLHDYLVPGLGACLAPSPLRVVLLVTKTYVVLPSVLSAIELGETNSYIDGMQPPVLYGTGTVYKRGGRVGSACPVFIKLALLHKARRSTRGLQ